MTVEYFSRRLLLAMGALGIPGLALADRPEARQQFKEREKEHEAGHDQLQGRNLGFPAAERPLEQRLAHTEPAQQARADHGGKDGREPKAQHRIAIGIAAQQHVDDQVEFLAGQFMKRR